MAAGVQSGAQLVEQVSAVTLGGVDADDQLLGDLGVAYSDRRPRRRKC